MRRPADPPSDPGAHRCPDSCTDSEGARPDCADSCSDSGSLSSSGSSPSPESPAGRLPTSSRSPGHSRRQRSTCSRPAFRRSRDPAPASSSRRPTVDRFGESPIGSNAIDAALAEIATQPDVVDVSGLVTSPGGDVGFVTVRYGIDARDVGRDGFSRLEEVGNGVTAAGMSVEYGGDVPAAAAEPEAHTSELIGLGVAMVVLLFAFGSVLAMGLPLISALFGLGVTLTTLALTSAVVDLSSTAPTLATMIGLAVGIDYSLFIVTRHRAFLHQGYPVEEAAARANATAGGAVVFAGMTVIIAISGLVVVGIPAVTVMGLGAALGVAVGVMVAISLLPAMLGFVGHNIDKLKVPGVHLAHEGAAHGRQSLGARWAGMVTRNPWRWGAIGLGMMLILTVPMFSLRLGMTDAGSKPPSSTERQAYDQLTEGFGPGFNGPLTVVVDLSGAADPEAAAEAVHTALVATDGLADVDPQTSTTRRRLPSSPPSR
ncbi:MAG: MMPL family transporter [Acidimicrobiia bacterium]|nr:MMPL family transporter [Acidimicrobiia bacterium]